LNDAATPGDVLTNGLGPQGQRFSSLAQLNASNVKKLVPAFAASLGGEKQRGQESQPLVYDGTIYVTGSYSRVFAFDARTGEKKWNIPPACPTASCLAVTWSTAARRSMATRSSSPRSMLTSSR
jgi:alcohol dehydrogenase (cytochrome c)